MKEYDKVKLIKDRDEYLKEGVHAGDIGYIIVDRIYDSCLVQFWYPDDETVVTDIRTEDLEVVESAPEVEVGKRRATICDKNGIRTITY